MATPELIPLLGARCFRVSEPGAEGILARLIKETTMNEGTSKFRFDMGDRVRMAESAEVGTIIGRAEYLTSENSYLVRYRAGDGRQTECWWGESAICVSEG